MAGVAVADPASVWQLDARLFLWDGAYKCGTSDRSSQQRFSKNVTAWPCLLSGDPASAAHLLKAERAKDAWRFRLSPNDVYNRRNGLPLRKDLEEEFDQLRWTLIPLVTGQMRVWVFDSACTAEQWHGRVVTPPYLPYRRILCWHARAAWVKARGFGRHFRLDVDQELMQDLSEAEGYADEDYVRCLVECPASATEDDVEEFLEELQYSGLHSDADGNGRFFCDVRSSHLTRALDRSRIKQTGSGTSEIWLISAVRACNALPCTVRDLQKEGSVWAVEVEHQEEYPDSIVIAGTSASVSIVTGP